MLHAQATELEMIVRYQRLSNFVRRRLGLKNLADYYESRAAMIGLTNLSIRTVLDIGANTGRQSRLFRRKFPAAQIFSIEPIPQLGQRLDAWARTQSGKVRVFNLALASQAGRTTFFVNRQSSIWSTLRVPDGADPADYEPISVDVETLDGLAQQIDFHDDVLIKIDTEGMDLEVLAGGAQTLRRTAAIIVESCFFPTPYGSKAPIFEDLVSVLAPLEFVYRGNVRCCWSKGICHAADALFVKRGAAQRIVA
jgi:FkbM family methyltransferase